MLSFWDSLSFLVNHSKLILHAGNPSVLIINSSCNRKSVSLSESLLWQLAGFEQKHVGLDSSVWQTIVDIPEAWDCFRSALHFKNKSVPPNCSSRWTGSLFRKVPDGRGLIFNFTLGGSMFYLPTFSIFFVIHFTHCLQCQSLFVFLRSKMCVRVIQHLIFFVLLAPKACYWAASDWIDLIYQVQFPNLLLFLYGSELVQNVNLLFDSQIMRPHSKQRLDFFFFILFTYANISHVCRTVVCQVSEMGRCISPFQTSCIWGFLYCICPCCVTVMLWVWI